MPSRPDLSLGEAYTWIEFACNSLRILGLEIKKRNLSRSRTSVYLPALNQFFEWQMLRQERNFLYLPPL